MKKLIWFLVLPFFTQAQVTFNHFYDFDVTMGPAVFRSIIHTADGGYALAGSVYHTPWSEFDNQGNEVLNFTSDILLVKTDAAFNVQWTKICYSVIDFSYEESGVRIKEKTGGGFILLTETEDPQEIYYTGRPANLISTDAAGVVLWSRSFSATTGYDKPFDFIIDADNSIIVAGSTNFSVNSRKPWAFKTDANGLLLWGNTYTTTTGEFRSIVRAPSGGYLLAGKRSTDVMLMRMTSSGTNIWTRTYSTTASEGAQTIINSGNGYAMLVNNTTAGSCQLLQTDSGGTVTSVKSYLQLTGTALIRNGNSFLITGTQSNSSIISFTTDLSGNITGSVRKYSIPSFVVGCNDAIQVGSNQYICGSAEDEAWLIKVDLTTGFSGGCSSSFTSLTSQAASFTFATINPGVNNLFMEEDVDALMADELIYINQYIICSCSPAQAAILNSLPVKFCPGSAVMLQAYAADSYQFQWFRNGVALSNSNSDAYAATLAGNYYVVVTSNCGSDTSDIIAVEQSDVPQITTVSSYDAAFGDTLDVTGYHLSGVTQASIGVNADILPVSDSLIRIVVPGQAFKAPLVLTNSSGCLDSSSVISIADPLVLYINVFIEGLYLGGEQTRSDTLTISLYNAFSPYACLYATKAAFDTHGHLQCFIPPSFYGSDLYIGLHHRNAIETWSAAPVLLEYFTVLDFTTHP
jgi:hypothetical protein